MDGGRQVPILWSTSVVTLVRSSEFCCGPLHFYWPHVPVVLGHEASVFREPGLPIYRPVTLALQIQVVSKSNKNFWSLHHLWVELDHWMPPFHWDRSRVKLANDATIHCHVRFWQNHIFQSSIFRSDSHLLEDCWHLCLHPIPENWK